jgi:cleavage stimulation factor subunit 2
LCAVLVWYGVVCCGVVQSVEIISSLVHGLSKPQQIELLTEMKKFVTTTPDAARQLLTDNPQVAQVVLQLLVLYGKVQVAEIQALHVNVRNAPHHPAFSAHSLSPRPCSLLTSPVPARARVC